MTMQGVNEAPNHGWFPRNNTMRHHLALAVIVGATLTGCAPSTSAPNNEGPLEMSSPEPGARIVTLIAESDGRERAVGNIRAVNTSDSANVTITGVTAYEPLNAEVGVAKILRLNKPGVDVMYEVDGVEYVEAWNTTYVIEVVDDEGCAR